MSERYEVIIAGFGPVGQTAANLLGQRGFRVAVFETATAIYDLPRAAHFDGETMRVFQSTGLAEAVMPACAPVHGIQFLNADRDLLFGLQSSGRTTASGWQTGYMFYQPDLEAALQAGVRRFDNVEVHTGHEVLGVTQDDDGVEVRVRDSAPALSARSRRTGSWAAMGRAASRGATPASASRTWSSTSRGSSSTRCSSETSTSPTTASRSATRRGRRLSCPRPGSTAAGSSC